MKASSKAKQRQGKKPSSASQRPYKASFVKKSHFKRNLAVLSAVIFLVVIAVYAFAQTSAGSSARPVQVLNSNWKNATLTNAVTGQTFTLSQYAGKVVVLQFMATYCQYCLAEGHQLVSVQQSLGGSSQASGQVVMISVDVDPSEHLTDLKNYVQQNNFGAASSNPAWIYAMDTSGQLLQSVAGNVDFGYFISLANMYFINQQQSNTFLSMQRSAIQDASPASDIIAVVNKLLGI